MHNLRFWQKTYLLTLLLFLVALYSSIFVIGWQYQQQMMNSEVEKSKTEQHFIAQNLAKDLQALRNNAHLRAPELIQSYSNYYAQDGILLEVKCGEEILYTTILEDNGKPITPPAEPGQQSWVTKTIQGQQYLFVTSIFEGTLATYTITAAHSLAPLTTIWQQMHTVIIIGSIGISLLWAVGLFFVLRSLTKPIEKLAAIADEFAGGNLDVRAVKKGNDEIGTLTDSFNHMAETAQNNIVEIQKTAEQNERMAANLSHEIRTPLTAIQGYAEYLRIADLTPEEQDTALAYIMEESGRLQKISQRMLQLYSLQHNEITKQPVLLSSIIEKVLLTTAPKASQKNVTINVLPLASANIMGDSVLLESLFTNLIDNAVKACADGGKIMVSSQVLPHELTLQIADNGCGMSEGELKKLGEPLYRPDKARSRQEGGAGLGVALCCQIARLHGATLTYASAPKKGTTALLKFTTP